MSHDYAEFVPEDLPDRCVWRGIAHRNHDLWADEDVCARCGRRFTNERNES